MPLLLPRGCYLCATTPVVDITSETVTSARVRVCVHVCVQGAGPTILKLTLNMGMRFTFFGWLRERAVQLNGGAPMSDLQSFLAGGVSGAVSVVVNHPVDVVVRAKVIFFAYSHVSLHKLHKSTGYPLVHGRAGKGKGWQGWG